jgi:putative endonuclease
MLRIKGYRILDRRWKSPGGDLIWSSGAAAPLPLSRSRRARPKIEALPPSVRVSAAASYLQLTTGWQQNPDVMDCDCRFDIVTVTPYQWPRHFANAFAADDQ